ncbi:GolD/DthD family dehydrogenase [Anaeromyxobacter oryzae]|uniref:D-threitol dehydrogenase n=1 Tax=Anaeromyxobacter oryzae TaxID=2918170 RepID=A0ABM7WPN5_9BACT|nr:D-threitol dehydrogenase [Anaeromyxobacter oryzae]BDG01425.1 D-threitol dehydrogenase [Anaeromyxobacter oryzae]
MFDLTGKTAIVTGGAGGIGLAIATLFAARGANQVLVGQKARVKEVAASLPGGDARHVGVMGDVADARSAAEVVDTALQRFGRIDVLVNNAGISVVESAEVLREADFDRVMAVNVKGPFLMSQAVGKVMIRQGSGRIVNIASQAGVVALDRHLAYCTSKFALIGLTKVLALEWAKHGITVNAVSPTVVETPLGKRVWSGEAGEAMKRKIPTGRFAQPEEIAAAVLYLVSDVAGMINGENLVIDGGYTIQ